MEIDPEQWPVLSGLLGQALEVPAEARERWLATLAPAQAVHRDTLRVLLEHHAAAETRDFLATLPKFATAGVSPGAADTGSALAPGTAIGPYIIEEEIGRGGMGTVWRSRRSDGVLKRPVALKLPRIGPNGTELIERFARERDILAGLAHPNIARLYDAGSSESGQPYLALEYVAGEPLVEYCDRKRLDITQRLLLFQQVLRAVQYAHSHLVVHRDIKPSNVMVGVDGHAMLLDFGIAKLMATATTSAAALTQIGGGALTPDYASPEQITGQPVTTAADIYSLGVLLFELLTGGRPYRLRRDTRGALEDAILAAEPLRPSQAVAGKAAAEERATTVAALASSLRGDLDTIVLHALKKVPGDRYATADAFSRDVEHYLRGEPVSVRADSAWYRTGKFIARHRFPVAGALAALIMVLAAAGVAFYEAHNASLQRDRALALSARNQAVTEFLGMLMTDAAGADKPMTVTDMLARSEALVNSSYRDNPEHRAAVQGMLGIHYHTMGNDLRGEQLLRQALEAVRDSPDEELRDGLVCDHALSLAGLGKFADAKRDLNRIIENGHTTVEQSATCLEYLAFVAQDTGDPADALKYGDLALQRLQAMPHPPPALEAEFLGSVGYAQQMNGHNDTAEKFYRRSIEEFAAAGRDRSTDAVSVRNNWAIVSDTAGVPRRALELYDESLRILTLKDPGAPPPWYLIGNRARALDELGFFDGARQGLAQCLSLTASVAAGQGHLFCLLALASLAIDTDDLAAGADYLAQAAAAIGPGPAPGFPPLTGLRTQTGRLALARGRLDEARSVLTVAIDTSHNTSQTMAALLVRSEVNLRARALDAAASDARAALALAKAAQGAISYSSRTGLAWLALGDALAAQKNTAEALDAYRFALAHLSHTVEATHPSLRRARQGGSLLTAVSGAPVAHP